jgi:hypothetical protein
MRDTRLARQTVLEAAVTAETDPEVPMKLALLQNEIAEGDFQQHAEVPIELTDSEKTQYNNDWRTYRERNAYCRSIEGKHSTSSSDSAPNCCRAG